MFVSFINSISLPLVWGPYTQKRPCQNTARGFRRCETLRLAYLFIGDSHSSNSDNEGQDKLVIKAQVLAGGRGKGRFDSGLQGGVHMVERFGL